MKKWGLLLIIMTVLLLAFIDNEQQETSRHVPQFVTFYKPQHDTQKVPQSAMGEPSSLHCEAINKQHKYQIDDWLFELQNNNQAEQWSAYLELLPQCLHEIAGHYAQFKQALIEVDVHLNLQERVELLHALQRQFFTDDVIAVWFEDSNSWDTHALTRWHILSDPAMSELQKQQLIEAHISELPKHEQLLFKTSAQLHALNANWQQQRYNELSAEYGDETATRILEVQKQQQRWQQKLKRFKLEKHRILVEFGESPTAKAHVEALLNQTFTENEQKRVAVLVE
ncbi:lipase secretion chaperone [Pseudoalteromonas piscicida]|uniref:lipase secretion chaperone n=1 Tax=Pseudoalteromonas piscicida TaxID=43662 RepID=UPI0030A6A445